MPNSVLFASTVELVLILATSFLLIGPKAFFRPAPAQSEPRIYSKLKWAGVFFLCFTFCWSVVLGIILSVNNLTLRV